MNGRCSLSRKGESETKMKNVTVEMMRGLDQLMERKEDEVREDYKMEKLARLYIDECSMGRSGPVTIISYHEEDLFKGFWQIYRKILGTVIGYEYGVSPQKMDKLSLQVFNVALIGAQKLKAARDRQKSYADNRRKLLEFEVVDQVLLKVSPWKGVVDKTLCFVEEPIEIIDREVKSLKRSRILIVKVYWNLKRGHEDFIKSKYPHLLVEQAIVRSTK
ncbi:hypothetical protein Tco_0719484 [Tanacetum coccineum]